MYSVAHHLLSFLTTLLLLLTTLTIAAPIQSPQSLIWSREPNTCTAEDAKSSCLLQNSVQKIATHCKAFCWPANPGSYDPVACGVSLAAVVLDEGLKKEGKAAMG